MTPAGPESRVILLLLAWVLERIGLEPHKRSLWIAGTMMEGTDHNEMGRGSSSFQQNSANCKFDSVEAAFSIAVMSFGIRVDSCTNPTEAPPKKVKVEQ